MFNVAAQSVVREKHHVVFTVLEKRRPVDLRLHMSAQKADQGVIDLRVFVVDIEGSNLTLQVVSVRPQMVEKRKTFLAKGKQQAVNESVIYEMQKHFRVPSETAGSVHLRNPRRAAYDLQNRSLVSLSANTVRHIKNEGPTKAAKSMFLEGPPKTALIGMQSCLFPPPLGNFCEQLFVGTRENLSVNGVVKLSPAKALKCPHVLPPKADKRGYLLCVFEFR